MPKENNKMQVDIENLFKQNVNDLSSIKELYRKLQDMETKILQIKYIDSNLANKLKKEYENFKKLILDENVQLQFKTLLEENNKVIDDFNARLDNDINEINSQLDTIANKGTTVEVLERVTKEEIERQIQDGTIANLTIADGSITQDKLSPDLELGVKDNSVTLSKLNNNIFGEKVKITNSLASWAFVELLSFPFISDSSDFEIEFKITPSQDIKQLKVSIGSVTSEAYTLTKDVETVINFSGTTSNLYKVEIQSLSSESISLDGIYENISLKINGEYISYTISTGEKVTMLYNEKSYLVTDKMLKNEINTIGNEINELRGSINKPISIGFNEINDEVKSYLVNYETIECSTSSTENQIMQVFLIDYLIKGKKIISIQKYQTNDMWVGFAIKEDGKIKVIDERNLTGSETGEREINYDIPDGGCYICLKGNVVGDNNGTLNFIQLSSTWDDGIGEYDMGSLPVPVQGYKNFSIKIQKYNSFTQIEEVKNEVNNIKNISDNKVTFGEYSMPVSLNQRMNLVEIFNNDFMIDKYIKTNCTIGTSNVTINQNGQIYYDKDIATDTYKIKFDFKVSDLNTKFGYITEITWNDKFSKTLLDCSKNTITTSFPSEVAAGSNKPDVVTNLDFNIQANTEYTFLVYKNGLTHTISIFDKKSGKKTSQELNLMCAWGIGKNGIACEQGSVNITNYVYSMTFPKYAEGIFIGDSITEGIALGTFDISKRWCSLIRDNYFNGNALIFGKGYDISTGALNRLKNLYELNIKSKYVFIMIGTNDSANDDDGYNTWVTNINNIYNLIIEHGAIPIIICPPLTKKPDQIKKMRNYILSNGWNTIRMDIALSKNQDGETYDSTNFTDGVHPNIDGAQKMYERALYDLEMII